MKKDGMDQLATPELTLDRLPVGARARIVAIYGGRGLMRRLMGLGLRVGTDVNVVHHRGRGVVIAAAGNRIALGGGVTEKLAVQALPPDSNAS
jgi:ferrous iron transport protein A